MPKPKPHQPDPAAGSRALVVEGGAMRGIFAAGVLDGFLDRDYRPFDFCLGVSVGSTNLAAWLAGQRGRNHRVITDYSCRPQFMSFKRFLAGGHWFDLDWLWDITIKEIRLDLERFTHQPLPLYVVVTRVSDGRAEYVQGTPENLEQLLKASCSVPLIYRSYPQLVGQEFTDGGVADAIPVIRAYNMGARDITVILSHPLGYRKKQAKCPWLIRRALKKTPALAQAVITRPTFYNQTLAFINEPPTDCRLRIIAPPEGFAVCRMTTDQRKLENGYNMGLAAAGAVC